MESTLLPDEPFLSPIFTRCRHPGAGRDLERHNLSQPPTQSHADPGSSPGWRLPGWRVFPRLSPFPKT